MSIPRAALPLLLLAAALPLHAQTALTDAQSAYLGAHVFDRQVAVFREYCAQDPAGTQAIDTGVAQFRINNPDYVAARADTPNSDEFKAAVAAFDAQFDQVAQTMRTQLAERPVGPQCATLGDELRKARFASLLEEAKQRSAATP